MTKKSSARVARDQAKADLAQEIKTNTNWSDLQERHAECQGLIGMHVQMLDILENPEIRAEIASDDMPVLSQNIRILTKDLSERNQELRMIYETHKEKTGGATEDDIMLSFEVMEKYAHWLALMQSIVQPTAAHIAEITSQAEKRLFEKSNITNKDVVSDIHFTETASETQQRQLDESLASADRTNPKSE